jgi:hypothetical protein
VSDTLYTTTAQTTFQVGPLAGLAFEPINGFNVFVEAAYLWRYFPSVEWAAVGGVVPQSLPRRLNFSGHIIEAGVQLELRPHTGK